MNWLDILIALPLILALIRGYQTGIIMQVATLIGLIISVITAGELSEIIYPYIPQIEGIPSYLLPPISYLVAFLIIVLIIIFIGKTIESLFKIVQLNFLNKIAGAAFGFIKWHIALSIILLLVVNIDQKQILLKESIRTTSILYKPMIKTGELLVPFLKEQTDILLSGED